MPVAKSFEITLALRDMLNTNWQRRYQDRPQWCDAWVCLSASEDYQVQQVREVAKMARSSRGPIWTATYHSPDGEGTNIFFWHGSKESVLERIRRAKETRYSSPKVDA
jgi:hypothetical protein